MAAILARNMASWHTVWECQSSCATSLLLPMLNGSTSLTVLTVKQTLPHIVPCCWWNQGGVTQLVLVPSVVQEVDQRHQHAHRGPALSWAAEAAGVHHLQCRSVVVFPA